METNKLDSFEALKNAILEQPNGIQQLIVDGRIKIIEITREDVVPPNYVLVRCFDVTGNTVTSGPDYAGPSAQRDDPNIGLTQTSYINYRTKMGNGMRRGDRGWPEHIGVTKFTEPAAFGSIRADTFDSENPLVQEVVRIMSATKIAKDR